MASTQPDLSSVTEIFYRASHCFRKADLSEGACSRKWQPHLASRGLTGVLLMFGMNLQGCIPASHPTAIWQSKASYITNFQVFAPNQDAPILNSCEQADLPPALQCSGHGFCRTFGAHTKLAFCDCDRDWADPECRTRRKSQKTTYFLSLFFGWLGADAFYLGDYWTAAAKLTTLGGFGFWWTMDIVWIGSAPVYSSANRLAPDLPHWVFMLSSTTFFMMFGYLYFVLRSSLSRYQQERVRSMKEMLWLLAKLHAREGFDPKSRSDRYGSL